MISELSKNTHGVLTFSNYVRTNWNSCVGLNQSYLRGSTKGMCLRVGK